VNERCDEQCDTDRMGDHSIKQEQNEDLFAILRREVREGRLSVIREEDIVKRCEENEIR